MDTSNHCDTTPVEPKQQNDKAATTLATTRATAAATTTTTVPTSTGAGAAVDVQTNEDNNANTTTNSSSLTTATATNHPMNNSSDISEDRKLMDSLIDEVIFCECLQVHRAAKMGLIFTEPSDEMYKIKEGAGLDVFGQPLSKKKQYNCICPNCSRNLAASRLAPHLEKCMGMGRLSARAATSKRDNT